MRKGSGTPTEVLAQFWQDLCGRMRGTPGKHNSLAPMSRGRARPSFERGVPTKSAKFAGRAAFTLAHAAPAGSKADYDAAVKTANTNYKAARAQCDSLKGNAKAVCVKEAKRDEEVAKANAEADKVKADADYSVGKEKCEDLKGNDKDVCVKDAKAAHEQALGSAKVEKAAATGTSTDVAEARADARKDSLEAAYKAEKEKCDAMSGDAKDKCVANVKAKYAK